LRWANLYRAKLDYATLTQAALACSNLTESDMSFAHLGSADLREANLLKASLANADLSHANLRKAYLGDSNLRNARFAGATLAWTRFFRAVMQGANFERAVFGNTILADVDLSQCQLLESATHEAPSSVGTDTLSLSRGVAVQNFLLSCNVSRELVDYICETDVKRPQSCFISYCGADELFAKRLRDALNRNGVQYWYAPEHATWGRALVDQITEGISSVDRVILICSESSLEDSDWVNFELAKTVEEENKRRSEKRANWRMAFPIQIDPYFSSWNHKLSPRMHEVLAGDFRGAKSGKKFEAAVKRLLDGLQHTG
jgi:uncharacterized protein YjbI with pentapeptide repeats